MLALQAANNETGVIQPVAAAAEIVHAAGGFVVCDAVQAAGKIDCELGRLGADAIVLSAHKFGGPKGAGALCWRSDSYHIKKRSCVAAARSGGCAPEPRTLPPLPEWPLPCAPRISGCGRKPRPYLSGGTSWRRKSRASRPARCFLAPGRKDCRIRPASPCPASRRTCCLSLWIWRVLRYRRVRPVRRER